jgi:hypothetical protein
MKQNDERIKAKAKEDRENMMIERRQARTKDHPRAVSILENY